jgi:hypothetical protein
MPNECSNSITIISLEESEISRIFEHEIKCLPEFHISRHKKNGIRFSYKTAWKADYTWLDRLHRLYPSCWIKNEWIAEDGLAGVWVADENQISTMEWNDLSLEDEHYMFM